MRPDPEDPVDALVAQQAELAGLVGSCSDEELRRDSRCPGWSVADVLLHLAQTNEMAVASLEGRLGEHVGRVAPALAPGGDVDDLAGALVAAERGEPVASLQRWQRSAVAQADAFRAAEPARRVQWVAGDMAARTLATTRLTETWIHTVDVAVALGEPPPPTARLWHTCRLTWRTVPYALARAGRTPHGDVAFDLVAPDGSRWVFGDPGRAPTVLTGDAVDLCTVAGQRGTAPGTSLRATGPDADDVLELVRTFA